MDRRNLLKLLAVVAAPLSFLKPQGWRSPEGWNVQPIEDRLAIPTTCMTVPEWDTDVQIEPFPDLVEVRLLKAAEFTDGCCAFHGKPGSVWAITRKNAERMVEFGMAEWVGDPTEVKLSLNTDQFDQEMRHVLEMLKGERG